MTTARWSSPRARQALERGLRTIALLALAAAIARTVWPDAARRTTTPLWRPTAAALSDSTATVLSVALQRTLRLAAADTGARALALDLPALPSPRGRALLGAVDGGGVMVRWRDGSGAAGLALSATAVAGPSGAVDVRVAGPWRAEGGPGALGALVLRDAGGTLDSITGVLTGGWQLASASSPLRVVRGASQATVTVPRPAAARRVLLMGLPGWESKFVAAALEEAGWLVDGRYQLSPRTAITVGAPARLDTARYAAVVVLDSLPVDAGAIGRFVRQGGGLVLAGDALRLPSLAPLRPARATGVRGAVAGALLTGTPQRGLEAWELVADDAASVVRTAPSDGGAADPVLVAARVGTGRVLASAYRNSWHWRMEGTDNGAAEHRRWWSDLLALAAGMPDDSAATAGGAGAGALPGDAAPYADLVARVGAPEAVVNAAVADPTGPETTRPDRRRAIPGLLFMVIAASLLGEWASRRLRGSR
jgi:hypothetical protein